MSFQTVLKTSLDKWDIKPFVTKGFLLQLVQDWYNLVIQEESIRELVSYEDRNFHVKGYPKNCPDECGEFVIKIYNFSFSDYVEFYRECLSNQLNISDECEKYFLVPVPLKDTKSNQVCSLINIPLHKDTVFSGCSLDELTKQKNVLVDDMQILVKHIVRVTRFLPGDGVDVKKINKSLIFDCGKSAGILINEMQNLSLPQLTGDCLNPWNVLNASKNLSTPYIESERHVETRQAYLKVLNEYDVYVAPLLSKLSKHWIHGDMSDQNMLQKDNRVVGILDFDLMVYSYRIVDVSITLMYFMAMSTEATYLENAKHVFAGIRSVVQLNKIELDVLYPLILMRFVQSLSIGKYTYNYLDPSNEYLCITTANGAKLFNNLLEMGKDKFLSILCDE